jgi:hypothetical protein
MIKKIILIFMATLICFFIMDIGIHFSKIRLFILILQSLLGLILLANQIIIKPLGVSANPSQPLSIKKR